MRFSNRTIVSYRTNVLVSHCIPQNHFRWNFSKRGSRGEQGLSNRAVQIRRYQSQSAHQKQPQSLQKYSSKISNNLSLNSVHQYTHQPIIQPLITPTLRSASGQGGSPGSRTLRRSSTTRWNNFTWLTWNEKCDTIILSKKCESLSLAKEKSLSQWKIKRYNEWKLTLPKAGRHEGLKIPFWRQSMGLPPPETLKISELFVDSNDCWTFFLLCFLEALERREKSFLHR